MAANVTVMPGGADGKFQVDTGGPDWVAIASLVFTALIPIVLAVATWWVDDRTTKAEELRAQAEKEAEQRRAVDAAAAEQLREVAERHKADEHERLTRLQAHTQALADTEALFVISDFKETCKEDLPEPLNDYAFVLGRHRPLGCVTRDDIRAVDRARKKLQGIWDNIKADFTSKRLPGSSGLAADHGGLLNRGTNYLRAVEPLEVVNYAKMQNQGHNAPADKPYMLLSGVVHDTPLLDHDGNALFDELGGRLPVFHANVRPSKFKWLEEEKYGQGLWVKEPVFIVDLHDPQHAKTELTEVELARKHKIIEVYVVDTQKWDALELHPACPTCPR